MSVLRWIVTVIVAVPLFLMVGWPQAWYVTLGIAVISLGAGHLAEFVASKAKRGAPDGGTGA
jgi:hypothetical protein